ncbi:MAG: DUF3078 domain-containing protein [Bacteroidaceae bacterium]|nr:DUF3078 domain-containing protein [Bacteroidaceae bacterium]
MRYTLFTVAILLFCSTVSARRHQARLQEDTDTLKSALTDSIFNIYNDALSRLVLNNQYGISTSSNPSPYYFRLLGPATLYNSSLTQAMGMTASNGFTTSRPAMPRPALPSLGDDTDLNLLRYEAINTELNRAYVTMPTLFTTTQNQFNEATPLRSELDNQAIEEDVQISSRVETPELELDIEPVEPEVQKPNFWTKRGNGSLQFTQNYFSENWYQGGEKNYSMLSALTVEANYDNKQKLQWDNKFEAQLGFQTSETDEYHKFKATNNLLRLTSKIGYKAAKSWNYAGQVQLQTQPYMSYDNKGNITADFVSPFYTRTSIGMDYKFKNKRLEGSLYLAPLSWNLTYVDRPDLRSRYNIEDGHIVKHDWGPNVNLNFTYKMWENISWTSRLYWFTSFELSRVEWENTINCTVNRYISAKLFIYPRFDDSTTKYKSESGSYWMFKQWLSLGLNYEF